MIPKCGTHLLLKCLSLMDPVRMPFKYTDNLAIEEQYQKNKLLNKLPPPNHYKGTEHPLVEGVLPLNFVHYMKKSKSKNFWNHFAYTSEYDNFLDAQQATKFLMVRDPRAMLISLAHMLKDGFEPGQYIDLEPLILDLIDGRKQHYISWGVSKQSVYPTIWEIGMCNFYKSYLPFIKSKNCFMVRFEHLIGSKGGGSDELQSYEIKQIAQHVGVTIDNKKVASIVRDLFGGSSTFREGQIDGWKKHFTPVIKEAFKKVSGANELLILLGYERDRNW